MSGNFCARVCKEHSHSSLYLPATATATPYVLAVSLWGVPWVGSGQVRQRISCFCCRRMPLLSRPQRQHHIGCYAPSLALPAAAPAGRIVLFSRLPSMNPICVHCRGDSKTGCGGGGRPAAGLQVGDRDGDVTASWTLRERIIRLFAELSQR